LEIKTVFFLSSGTLVPPYVGANSTVGDVSNPVWGEIFCNHTDRPWCLPSLLHNGYRVFPGG